MHRCVPHNRAIPAMHIKCSPQIDGLEPVVLHVGNGLGSLSFPNKGPLLPPPFPRWEDLRRERWWWPLRWLLEFDVISSCSGNRDKNNLIVRWRHGIVCKEKKLLKSILEDTNTKFLVWAIDKIMHWKNKEYLPNVITIHGSIDRVLPYTQADFCIRNGSHLMIINRADEVSSIIRKILGQ